MKQFYQMIYVKNLFFLIVLILGMVSINVQASEPVSLSPTSTYIWDEATGTLTLESTSPTLEDLNTIWDNNLNNIIRDGSVKVLVVKGNFKSVNLPFYNAPAKANLTTVDLSESKLAEVKYCFYESPQLTTVKLPKTLKKIVSDAFKECPLLREVTLTDSIETIESGAFYRCTSLEKITIPASVKTIGGAAFADCPLTELNIPAGITSIGSNAFACKTLTKLTIASFLDNTVFSPDVLGTYDAIVDKNRSDYPAVILKALPRPLISDDGKAIYLLSDGENVVVPEGIEYICSNLEQRNDIKTLQLPNTLKYVGEKAFGYCYELQTPAFPASLDYVGPEGFKLNEDIITSSGLLVATASAENYTVPEGVKTISSNAFYYKRSLKSVSIPTTVTRIDPLAFYYTGLKAVELPASIDSLGHSAFKDCRSLESAVLPDGLTSVSHHLFSGCKSLTSISLPSHVRSIGTEAFQYVSLTGTLSLPASLQFVDNYAFSTIDNLQIENGEPLQIGSSAFGTVNTLYLNRNNIKSVSKNNSIIYDFINVDSLVIIGPAIKFVPYIFAGNAKRVVVPETVDSIAVGAFKNLQKLEEITLPFIGCNRKEIPGSFNSHAAEVDFYDRYFFGTVFGSNSNDKYFTQYMEGNGHDFNFTVHQRVYNVPSTLKKVLFTGEKLDYYRWMPMLRVNEKDNYEGYNSTWYYFAEYVQDSIALGNVDLFIPNASDKLFEYKKLDYWRVPYEPLESTKDALYRYDKNSTDEPIYLRMFRDVNLEKLASLPEHLFAKATRLEKVVLPFPGAGTNGGYKCMGDLFSQVANPALTLTPYEGQDGTTKNYYVPATLKDVSIAEGCTRIPYSCFANFSMLQRVSLPSTITGVEKRAFYNCYGMTELIMDKQLPPVAFDESFEGCSQFGCTLMVPAGSKQYYSVANGWKYFFLIDEEILADIEHVGTDGLKPTVICTFNLGGRRLNATQRGLNIIRMSDGTVRKVMVK